MSFKEEKDEGHLDQTAMTQEIKDELVYIIHTSLNSIVRQVNDLNKNADDLRGKLTKEVDRVSSKLQALQENVIRLNDSITHKVPNEGLSMQIRKLRKTFPSTTVQTQQVYSSKSLPVKTFQRHNANVQMSPLTMSASYHQDDIEGLMISSDVSFQSCSYFSELCKEKIISKSKEQKKEKFTQNKKGLDHPNEPESVLQCQQMEKDVSVDHIPASFGKVSHSYVDQPEKRSSFSPFPPKEVSKFLTGTVGKVKSSPLHPPIHGAGDVKNTHTYVNYGTGLGEEVKFQPQTRFKTEVFVSPMAPTSPPPLPSDWLALLRASKRSNPPAIIHSPTELSLPITKTMAASYTDCLQTTFDTDLPVIPPKAEFSPSVPEPFQYSDLKPDYRNPQGEDGTISPLLVPSPVIPSSIQSGDTVTDIVNSPLAVPSPRSAVFQPVKSSFSQSPRHFISKSPISSLPSKPRSSHPPLPQNLVLPTSESSVTPLPRSSTPQRPPSLFPVSSISSCPQTPISSSPLPRHSLSPLSSHLDSQLSRSSDAKSRHLNLPQSRSPTLRSTKFSTLRSLFSFGQSPPSVSKPTALSMSQYSVMPICPGLKQSVPSTLPIVSQSKSALMEAIRKEVQLRKTKDQCVPKTKTEIPKSETNFILIRRKAMGYSSGISDSESD